MNPFHRPALRALIGLGVAALALAPTETTAQPAPLPAKPFDLACAPVGSSRSLSVGGTIVRATTSMGVSTENPDYCLVNTAKGPKNYFVGFLIPPSPEGRAEAARKMRNVLAGRVSEEEFDLVWDGIKFNPRKLHEKWRYMGTGVLQLESGPLTVVTVRRYTTPMIGGNGLGMMDISMPLVDGTVFLMPVALNIPDPSKSSGFEPWNASRFELPSGDKSYSTPKP